jgi:hypothetical protein
MARTVSTAMRQELLESIQDRQQHGGHKSERYRILEELVAITATTAGT